MASLRKALEQSRKQWATKNDVLGIYPTVVIRQRDGNWLIRQYRLEGEDHEAPAEADCYA